MEDAYRIHGGKQLKGEVVLSGAKNAALKIVIGALLFDGKVTLNNVPRIRDLDELLHLIIELGATAELIDTNTVVIDGTGLKSNTVDLLHGSKIRSTFLLFAPLLRKFKEAHIPNPGGCRIGARPIDRIMNGLKELGGVVEYDHATGFYHSKLPHKTHGSYTFEKPSHTGTEFMIMLSIFAEGSVKINNAALEPEIDDLISFFNEGGAQIRRKGTSIIVDGVTSLTQKKPYTIVSDRNEAVTFAVLGLITKGDVTVGPINPHLLDEFIATVTQCGGGVEIIGKNKIRFYHKGPFIATQVETEPHPGFMTDWQQNWVVLMTQAKGISTVHERVFENRFAFVSELQKLGAKIEYDTTPVTNPKEYYHFTYNPEKVYKQAIKIYGPQKLHSGVLTVTDLRAGATLAIAALLVPGESIVNGVSILERGYERFVEKVIQLGGDIKRL
ncbi:MAG: UDP-N-acetylglucosamine 1-carboxyvinyltransferase [bacterium]